MLRDGSPKEIPADELVPGDVILLRARDAIPGDCLILESKDLFVNEAALTGETRPEEEVSGVLPPETSLGQRKNTLFKDGVQLIMGDASVMMPLVPAAVRKSLP